MKAKPVLPETFFEARLKLHCAVLYIWRRCGADGQTSTEKMLAQARIGDAFNNLRTPLSYGGVETDEDDVETSLDFLSCQETITKTITILFLIILSLEELSIFMLKK